MIENSRQPSLTVYLRASASMPARARQREVIERAERLAATGRVADVTVKRWEDRVVVGDDPDGAIETFEAFKSRAAEIDHSIEPFFQEYRRTDTHEIVFPIICLAVHVDEELQRVFPCRDEEGAHSVWDCLTGLETASGSAIENGFSRPS